MWQMLSPMRQEQNTMSTRGAGKPVFIRDLLSGRQISTSFAIRDAAEAASQAVKAGTDLECGSEYKNIITAVGRGLLTEAEIDVSVKRLFTARFKLGMFDPGEIVPYSQIPFFVNCSDYNNSLSREADAVVLVLGLSQRLEGEEMPIKLEGFSGGDRTNLNLPAVQEQLLDAVCATGKPQISGRRNR